MPDDSGGNYSLPDGYLAVTGQKVRPINHNPPLEDIASALTNRYSRDGRAPLTGNMNANGFKVTRLGNAIAAGDAVNKSQLDSAVSTLTDGKVNKAGDTMTGPLNLVADDIWKIRVGIGEFYIVDTSITGVEIPPSTTTGVVFVQLTAGLTGSGQYNNGKLTSESVSGSAPDVLATAVVSVTGSPINGRTIRHLNTEGRIIRPYVTSGTILSDAIRNITGSFTNRRGQGSVEVITGLSSSGLFTDLGMAEVAGAVGIVGSAQISARNIGFDASNSVPTANENRMKMLGVTVYMRVR
jgi:hypothetical protein